ncbi:MAG: hypothetical protein KDK07_04435 [Bauldia sp.]|nr:hypothetical protein [Bauldia sp.]
MPANVARKPADVVNDDDNAIAAMLGEEGQHFFHAGAVDAAAGHVVIEDTQDRDARMFGELAAAGFLRTQTVTSRA